MAAKSYHKNVVCNAAADGAGVSTNRALRRCRSVTLQAIRRPIVDRSDHSYVPTVLDVVHEGWRWRVVHRDPERAQTWLRDAYLGVATFYIYQANNLSTYDTVVLRGMVVDEWSCNNPWGELAEFTVGGFCSLADFNGTSLENLTARTAGPNAHIDYWDGDTVNHWDSGGA